MGKTTHLLFEKLKTMHSKEHPILILGGDHSIAIGSIAAALVARKNLGIVWVDAHGRNCKVVS